MRRKLAQKRMNRFKIIPCIALVAAGLYVRAEDTPAAPAQPAAAAAEGAKAAGKDNGKGSTEITAREASFDSKKHVGVFMGAVTVENPQFNIKCDKLTAYMHHSEAAPAGQQAPSAGAKGAADPKPSDDPKAAKGSSPAKPVLRPTPAGVATPIPIASGPNGAPAAPGKPAPAAPDQKASGLEKAIAEGNVLIIQDKKDADGKIQHGVGHAQTAFYDATTGDVTLVGRPDIQQGENLCISLDDSTVMILNREGRIRVHGPSKSVLAETGGSSEPDAKK